MSGWAVVGIVFVVYFTGLFLVGWLEMALCEDYGHEWGRCNHPFKSPLPAFWPFTLLAVVLSFPFVIIWSVFNMEHPLEAYAGWFDGW